jgi:hypothetical protein
MASGGTGIYLPPIQNTMMASSVVSPSLPRLPVRSKIPKSLARSTRRTVLPPVHRHESFNMAFYDKGSVEQAYKPFVGQPYRPPKSPGWAVLRTSPFRRASPKYSRLRHKYSSRSARRRSTVKVMIILLIHIASVCNSFIVHNIQ